MTLWVYDPGQTTGYAKFSLSLFELTGFGEFELWGILDEQIRRDDIVVYEDIKVLAPSFNPIGLQVIGVIRFLCELRRVEVHAQQPSVIKGVLRWPILRLNQIKSPHARDAIAHGIYYIKSLQESKSREPFDWGEIKLPEYLVVPQTEIP